MTPDTHEAQKFQELYQRIAPTGNIIFTGTLLARAAQLWPERTALICEDTSISYRELYQKASRLTHKLLEMGVTTDDRIMLLWQNSIEFFIAYYGIWQTGAVVAPLNTMLHEAEIASIIVDAQPKAIVVSASMTVKLKNAHNNFTVLSEQDLNLMAPVTTTIIEPPIPDKDADAVAVILYTSGTTGHPKGVMLSSRNIMTNIIQGAARLKITENDRAYGALPFFHAFAQNCCIWSPIFFGGITIIVPKVERDALLRGLQHKPTFFVGVPAFYGLLSLLKTAPLESVRYFISGADVLPNKIRASFELLYGRKICNGYGLTETSPFVSLNFDDVTTTTGNVGKPLREVTVLVKDEHGNELSAGQVGVLWVKGDNVMLGYYNAPEATTAVLQDGWFNTGDLGYIDKRGNIILTGRLKDTIKYKGINIYPPEIENILLHYEGVTQAAVVGKKVDIEEVPIAFVAGPNIEALSEHELKQWCVQHLASYKVPRRVIILEKLPLTATGKVDKKQLVTKDIKLHA